MKQVHEHRESTQRQYALSERAKQFGWPSHAVEIVDEDLGQSEHESQYSRSYRRCLPPTPRDRSLTGRRKPWSIGPMLMTCALLRIRWTDSVFSGGRLACPAHDP